MPLGVGLPEILVVLVIALIVLGPKRLPETGKALGRGIRSFKASVTGEDEDDDLRRPVEAPRPSAETSHAS